MKKLLVSFICCYCLISVYVHAMDLGSTQDAPESKVFSLQKIAANVLAKETGYSYFSRPTASELTETKFSYFSQYDVSELTAVEQILANTPSDLWPEITATHPKKISLANTDLRFLALDTLIEHPDATKIAMTSSLGYLSGIDLLDETIYKKMITFDTADSLGSDVDETRDHDEDSDDRYDAWQQEWLEGSKEEDSSSDYAFSSDDEISDNVSVKIEKVDKKKEDIIFEDTYYNFPVCKSSPSLSSDGCIWGAVSTTHNDKLCIGEIKDIFNHDTELSPTKIHYVAKELGVCFGDLSNLVIKPDNRQYAAVWQSMASRFTNTHKIIFCQEDGAVIETEDLPRIKSLIYAHNKPLLAVGHEVGIISLWNTQNAAHVVDFDFFEEDGSRTCAVAFSHDDSIIYVSNLLGDLCAFNRDTEQSTRFNNAHDGMVDIIRSHPHGLCVATASQADGKIILWNKDVTKKIKVLDHAVTALNFSRDGTFLYLLTTDKTFHRIPLGTPLELLSLRAWLSCKQTLDGREAFKNWDIYKKVMMCEPEKTSLLGASLRAYFTQKVGR